jgi:hypothetical protein
MYRVDISRMPSLKKKEAERPLMDRKWEVREIV